MPPKFGGARPGQRDPGPSPTAMRRTPDTERRTPAERKSYASTQRKNYREILAGMGVNARQKWLRRMGYNVAVDGILGPQTKSATQAFLGKVQPSKWNKNIGGAKGGSKIEQLRHSDEAPVNVPKAPKTGGSKSVGRLGGLGGVGTSEDDFIDPISYARSLIESEYGPAIGELNRNIGLQKNQGEQNLADVSSWFNQLEGTRASGAKSNEDARARLIAEMQAAQQGMSQALGGAANPAGSEGAEYSGINLAALQGQGASQGNFDTNMKSILAAQGVDAKRSVSNQQQQIMQELTGKRSDLFKAKGSAHAKALGDAMMLRTQQRGQNIQQAAALQALELAKAMGPMQLENEAANIGLKKQQLLQQGASFTTGQREKALDYQIKRAQLQDFIAQLEDNGQTSIAQWTPKDRANISNQVTELATWGKGNVKARQSINSALSMLGLNVKDPKVASFARDILLSHPSYAPNKGKKKK